jgi:predicted acylesterase/phospholipase RssA
MSSVSAPAPWLPQSLAGVSRSDQCDADSTVRVAVVLSGGGLRGAGHIGVLQQLVAHNIPIDIIVGSSAGAVVAAYYAAVGLTLDELISDAREFRGRHLLAHSLNVRLGHRLDRVLGRASGLIPTRLEQLELATFDRLHHGVRSIAIVCHDLKSGRPRYFSTGCDRGVSVSDIVRASASIPYLFPSIPVQCGEEHLLLTDGGISDCLPIAFARRPPLSATHLIVSDCRWLATEAPDSGEHLIYVRPRLFTTGTLWAPSSTLLAAVRRGAAAVTDEILDRARSWRSALSPRVTQTSLVTRCAQRGSSFPQ